MEVTRVAFEPPDSRFIFERMGNDPIMLEPQKNNIVSVQINDDVPVPLFVSDIDILKCLSIGTLKIIKFPFGTNGKLMLLCAQC